MQKTCLAMDLDEWEILPDKKSFLDFSHDGKKDVLFKELIVDMNYFICPSPPLIQEKENSSSSKQVLAPVSPDATVEKNADEEANKELKDVGVVAPVILVNHHDAVSQVFFKKLKENSVDMKVDSPRPNTRGAIVPHAESEQIQFSEDEEEAPQNTPLTENEEEETEKEKDHTGSEIKGKACRDGFGLIIRNWRLAGIGAICSMGAAAAGTICIFIFGGRQQQRQRIQFSRYADDKRMKAVVQQATRLNQAVSAVRGAPMTAAHISFGGYYASV